MGRQRSRGFLLAVPALLVVLVPLLVDDRFVLKVLTFVGINALVVVGLALLFGYAGQVSLGHAGFMGLGAYTSAYLTVRLEWPWLAGIVAAALVAALGGLLLALPSLRLRGHYLAMATLGFGEIMFIAFVEAEPLTGGVDGFTAIPYASVGAFEFGTPELNYWLVWATALLAVAVAYNVVRLRPGRAMRALHGSELGARACGVDIVRVKVQVFVLSAALAGIAGALYAHLVGFISPSIFTLHFSVILLAMTVLGGTSSIAGPVLAAALLTLLPYVDAILPGVPESVATFLSEWETDIYGLSIILVMLFAPGGVAGLLRRVGTRRGRSSVEREAA